MRYISLARSTTGARPYGRTTTAWRKPRTGWLVISWDNVADGFEPGAVISPLIDPEVVEAGICRGMKESGIDR